MWLPCLHKEESGYFGWFLFTFFRYSNFHFCNYSIELLSSITILNLEQIVENITSPILFLSFLGHQVGIGKHDETLFVRKVKVQKVLF